MRLRTMEPRDHEQVLVLNQGALEAVGPLDLERLAWIVELADQAVVVDDDDDEIAGFAITLAPGTDYDSQNYRWFEAAYEDFDYLDRVVVSPSHRRRGVGTVIYDALEEAGAGHGQIALEVYAVPPNEGSLAFHSARGYVEVGRYDQPNGKIAAMFLKPLTA